MSMIISIRHKSISSIDILVEIITRLLFTLYGALGSAEFNIEGFNYFEETDVWKVRLKRRIDDLILFYEVTINNTTGEIIGFDKDTE